MRILLILFITFFTSVSYAGDGSYMQYGAKGGSVSDETYGASWDGVTTTAPSKNVVYDKIETLGTGGTDFIGWSQDNNSPNFTLYPTTGNTVTAETVSATNVTGNTISGAKGVFEQSLDLEELSTPLDCFKDTILGNTADGINITAWRNAAEGSQRISMFVDQYNVGNIYSPADIVFSANTGSANIDAYSNVFALNQYGNSNNGTFRIYGNITEAGGKKYAQFQVNDTTDNLELTRQSSDIQNFDIQMPLICQSITATNVSTNTVRSDWIYSDNLIGAGIMVTGVVVSGDTIRAGGSYDLPTAEPTDNQIMKYDAGTGKVVWEADAGAGGNSVYIEEGDAARVNSSAADLYVDFDNNDFDVGTVGNEANITVNSSVGQNFVGWGYQEGVVNGLSGILYPVTANTITAETVSSTIVTGNSIYASNFITGEETKHTIPQVATIQFTITEPDQLAETSKLPLWSNATKLNFNIEQITMWSDTPYNAVIKQMTEAGDEQGVIVDFGTYWRSRESVYAVSTTTVSWSVVSSSTVLYFDVDTGYTPDYVKFTIVGNYSGFEVN